MNRFGLIAKRHWQRWLPNRYAELAEPDSYFSILGEEIQVEIDQLSTALAGDDRPGETNLEKLGRLNMCRLNAETQVLAEMAFLQPEPEMLESSEDESELPDPQPSSSEEWIPLREDPNHPWWRRVKEEEESLKDD